MKNHPRLAGLVFAVVSFAASSALWLYTLAQAREGQERLYLPTKGLIVFVSFGFMGLVLTIGGENVRTYSRGLRDRRKTWRDWMMIGSLTIPGFIAYAVLRHQLQQLGYTTP